MFNKTVSYKIKKGLLLLTGGAILALNTSCGKEEDDPITPTPTNPYATQITNTEAALKSQTSVLRNAITNAKTVPYDISSDFNVKFGEKASALGITPANIIDTAKVSVPVAEFYANNAYANPANMAVLKKEAVKTDSINTVLQDFYAKSKALGY